MKGSGFINESILDEDIMSSIDHRMPAKENFDRSLKFLSGGGSFGPICLPKK
jgi:hypothetical protein